MTTDHREWLEHMAGRMQDGRGDAIRAALATIEKMAELLKELEWSEYDEAVGAKEACPICGRVSRTGHTASCRLAAVLKSLEGT